MSQIYLYLCAVKNYILLLLSFPLFVSAQCDLELLNFDPIVGEITVAFNNTENCGGAAGPTGIAEIQFGFQALDSNCNAMNQGWDFPWGLSTSDDSNHPGWIYSATTTLNPTNWTSLDIWADYNVDPPYYTGDTITFPLDDFYQAGSTSLFSNLLNAFDFWMGQGLGIQAVIWQISYGPTMYADEGGWAEVGGLGGGITPSCCGIYDDDNFLDNWIIMCPDDVPEVIYVYDTVYVELPPDTIIEYVYDTTYIELPPDTVYVLEVDTVVEYDTIPVPIHWYFYDTTYIYVTDTLIEYVELPADTIVLTEYDTTYIYVTDTITVTETVLQVDTIVDVEFIYLTDTLVLDCDTGEPCIEVLTPQCIGGDLYIPNTFTPNNDGLNDVWEIVYDPECWENVTFTIFNRWGATIYWGNGDHLMWDGSVHGGSHYVADGTYVYTCTAKNIESAEIVQESGYITVFR